MRRYRLLIIDELAYLPFDTHPHAEVLAVHGGVVPHAGTTRAAVRHCPLTTEEGSVLIRRQWGQLFQPALTPRRRLRHLLSAVRRSYPRRHCSLLCHRPESLTPQAQARRVFEAVCTRVVSSAHRFRSPELRSGGTAATEQGRVNQRLDFFAMSIWGHDKLAGTTKGASQVET